MLTVKKERKCETLTLEIDEYVPFTIEFGSKPPQLLYWRGGDGKLSLIEIALDRKSGAVSSATLTSISSRDVKETEKPFNKGLPESDGVAVFELDGWDVDSSDYSASFLDEFDSNVSLMIGHDYLAVIFSEDEPMRYIKNDQVRLGVSLKNKLTTLEIIGLTSEQVEILKQAL